MKTVPSKDEFLIDILGTQKPDDAQEDVIHVTTVGGYLATKTGNKLIRYKEYDPENRIGSLGRFLTFELADSYSYKYEDGKNKLAISKNI